MPSHALRLTALLLSLFALLFLSLSLALFRFAYRKRKSARSGAVDPAYELTEVDGQGKRGKGGKKWFGGRWGVTPVAEEGPGRTRQYLSGWFGLDAPSGAGWSAASPSGFFPPPSNADPSSTSTSSTTTSASPTPRWHESHFSRASRASRRAAVARSVGLVGSVSAKEPLREEEKESEGKEKKQKERERKKPRVSRTTELGMLENDAGSEDEEEADGKEAKGEVAKGYEEVPLTTPSTA